MNDYSFFKILSYLYTLDEDGEHYLYRKYIGSTMSPATQSFLSFLSFIFYFFTPIILVILKVKWFNILGVLLALNVFSFIVALIAVWHYKNIKYKYLKLEELYKERDALISEKREIENNYYHKSPEVQRCYDYYLKMLELCNHYIYKLEEKEKLKKEKEHQENMTEEDKIIDKYKDEFNNFIEYVNKNIKFLKNHEYDFNKTINEIQKNGKNVLELVEQNKESNVLLNKTFTIYIEEIKSIITNLNKVKDLRTDKNIEKFIKVLESFNTYFKTLGEKIIEFKSVNLEISMNTILKELDIDNSNKKGEK